MTTQHSEVEGLEDWKEEFWYKVAEWNNAQPEDIDIYANQLEMLIEYHMREKVKAALLTHGAKEREAERWRCHGIVGNYLTPPRINLAAERRVNRLLESLQEDINDPEQMPIDEDGKFTLTPQTDVTK